MMVGVKLCRTVAGFEEPCYNAMW